MQLYANDLAGLVLMLAFGGVLGWAALRGERSVPLRLFALGFTAMFLLLFLPGAVRSVRAKHALSQLVSVPQLEQIRVDGASPKLRTIYVYTALSPEAVHTFYADTEHTRGWQRQGDPRGLNLSRGTERLDIRTERGSWDGTRGTLGLARITYRWEQNAAP